MKNLLDNFHKKKKKKKNKKKKNGVMWHSYFNKTAANPFQKRPAYKYVHFTSKEIEKKNEYFKIWKLLQETLVSNSYNKKHN